VTIALLAGMTFLVVAETFIPSGSTPGSLYLARGARNGLGRTERYSQIGRILVRRGLLPTCGADAGPSSAPRMVAPA
jgi:ubiquinone biosynthesis protein